MKTWKTWTIEQIRTTHDLKAAIESWAEGNISELAELPDDFSTSFLGKVGPIAEGESSPVRTYPVESYGFMVLVDGRDDFPRAEATLCRMVAVAVQHNMRSVPFEGKLVWREYPRFEWTDDFLTGRYNTKIYARLALAADDSEGPAAS